MRGLDRGETFIVTRRGVPVGELIPIRRHRFAARSDVARVFASAAPIGRWRFIRDWIGTSARTPNHVADAVPRGLVDTSVVIDLDRLDSDRLPKGLASRR